MTKRLLLFWLMFVLVPSLLFPGTTGKLAGWARDKDTGEGLYGANIIVEGTFLGAAADENGYYFIINVPPGKYRVRATMMGFQPLVQTEVQVVVDQTTRLNFELSSTVLIGEAVEIVAERPLIQQDQTSSSTYATSEQIETMPVQTFSEVMVINPGFVETGTGTSREVHVRGGRGGELAYMIDGFYVREPLSNDMGSNVANVGIAELATMTGAFSAEYGQALSGVVNIVTKEGSRKYEGRVRFRTDKYVNPHKFDTIQKYLRDGQYDWVTVDGIHVGGGVPNAPSPPDIYGDNKAQEDYWFKDEVKVDDFNTYRTDFSLGGPIPFLGENHTFFVSGEYVSTDTYLGWTGYRFDEEYSPYRKDLRLNGKLVLRPTTNMKLVFGGVYDDSEWKPYNHTYKYIPNAVRTHYRDDYMVNFTLSHILSPKTFYTVKGSRFTTNYNEHVKGWEKSDFFSYQDEDGVWQTKNPDGSYTGKAQPIFPDAEYEFDTGAWEVDEVTGDSTWKSIGGGGWIERDNITNALKFDLTSQVSRTHQLKVGFEGKVLELQKLEVYSPWVAIPWVESYSHKPVEASAYILDKMEFEDWGLVVNAGLRLDYMDTKAKYFKDPHSPTVSTLEDAEKKLYLSPRLGIAHPITDKAVLHFSYGHFFQVPEYQRLYYFENDRYAGYPYPDMSVDAVYTWLGNANAKPEKDIAYEIGIETRISGEVALDVALFYKDIYDYLALERVLALPCAYHRATNIDYANHKGIELSLRKRFSRGFGGQINYTYSTAQGIASGWDTHFYNWYSEAEQSTYPAHGMVNLDWDQTHTLNFVLDLRKNDWGLNVIGTYGSGLPYTPQTGRSIRMDEVNSARMPWTMNVNLRATKMFKFVGLQYTLYADIKNLLNKKNVLEVFNNTGKPDASIDWRRTKDWVTRPYWYSQPRTLELGLAVGF